jgi:hypothetical protein
VTFFRDFVDRFPQTLKLRIPLIRLCKLAELLILRHQPPLQVRYCRMTST